MSKTRERRGKREVDILLSQYDNSERESGSEERTQLSREALAKYLSSPAGIRSLLARLIAESERGARSLEDVQQIGRLCKVALDAIRLEGVTEIRRRIDALQEALETGRLRGGAVQRALGRVRVVRRDLLSVDMPVLPAREEVGASLVSSKAECNLPGDTCDMSASKD